MAGNTALAQPVFDDLILHISPDKFYFESLTVAQVRHFILEEAVWRNLTFKNFVHLRLSTIIILFAF